MTIGKVASDKHSIKRARNIGYKTFTNNVFMLILLHFIIRRFSSLLFLKKDIRVRLLLQNNLSMQPCRSCGITIGCVVLRLRNNAGVPVQVCLPALSARKVFQKTRRFHSLVFDSSLAFSFRVAAVSLWTLLPAQAPDRAQKKGRVWGKP